MQCSKHYYYRTIFYNNKIIKKDDIPSRDIQELPSDNNNIETPVPVDEEVKELQNDSEPVVLDGVDQG